MILAIAPHEVTDLLAVRNGFKSFDDLSESMQGRLFEFYCDNGEMPYGTAKARDGDPMEWISQRLSTMTEVEFLTLIA